LHGHAVIRVGSGNQSRKVIWHSSIHWFQGQFHGSMATHQNDTSPLNIYELKDWFFQKTLSS
jgi:hypothetical protein